jgi:hypothetical protein
MFKYGTTAKTEIRIGSSGTLLWTQSGTFRSIKDGELRVLLASEEGLCSKALDEMALKWILRNTLWGYGLDLSHQGETTVVNSSEHGNECLDSIKGGTFDR